MDVLPYLILFPLCVVQGRDQPSALPPATFSVPQLEVRAVSENDRTCMAQALVIEAKLEAFSKAVRCDVQMSGASVVRMPAIPGFELWNGAQRLAAAQERMQALLKVFEKL